jgi:hypothetical protein
VIGHWRPRMTSTATDSREPNPRLRMTIYVAEPGSPTAEALALLASWAATHETQHADTL